MAEEMTFQERYEKNDTPWEINRPDNNLIQAVANIPIKPCRAIDIGCGTGNNAIWMAEHNFDVTGCDISEIAINTAKQKAANATVKCSLYALDFLEDVIPGAPFWFAFDRGCFHSFKESDQLPQYAEKVVKLLEVDGLWLSLIGNADEIREGEGPPQLTANQVAFAVEPYFEIVSLAKGHFDSSLEVPHRSWVTLMKKRKNSRIK